MARQIAENKKPDPLDAPLEQPESIALAIPQGDAFVSMVERLASNKDVDVDKLQRLLDMQERILAHHAKAEFDAAFSEMQGEIPAITERGEIAVGGQLRSKYAKFEDILEVVRPILTAHGFSIRHRNVFEDGHIKIIGILSHRSGHSEQDEFVAKADDSGSKNAIQALGSTRSYGQRYTTIALLNIATRGADDDGSRSEKGKAPEAPAGYEKWFSDIVAVADEGLPKLEDSFRASKREFREYLTKHDPLELAKLKTKARAVK